MISAYVTQGRAKFLLLHHPSKGADAIKGFFGAVHAVYVRYVANPLRAVGAPISSKRFDAEVNGLARKFLAL